MTKPHIFSREFWRAYWVAIRRSTRDRRDLKHVLLLTAYLIVVILYYGYFIWSAKAGFDIGTGLILSVVIFFVVTGFVGRWASNKLDERKARKEADLATNKMLRRRLASDGFALSVLLSRTGSEQMLREKLLPPEIEVVTRRFHIDRLRELKEWDRLPMQVRNLLLMPDGHWPLDLIATFRQSFETLRCLRWVLRVDESLEPLSYLPRMKYETAQELVEKPERLLSSIGMLETWDIRVERNKADVFFSRCYAEAIGRGWINDENGHAQSWAIGVYESARDLENRDTLVGYETVGELDEMTLRYITGVAFQRYKSLQLMMNLSDGADSWEEWTALCFPPYISESSEASK